MHTMASDVETVMDASDDETVLEPRHGEYSIPHRILTATVGTQVGDIIQAFKKSQYVQQTLLNRELEELMINTWDDPDWDAMPDDIKWRTMRGENGAIGFIPKLSKEEKAAAVQGIQDASAKAAQLAVDAAPAPDLPNPAEEIPLPRPPKTYTKRAFALAPKIYPPPPPPKITTEEWQDIEDEGAWEDDMIEDDATNAQKKKKKKRKRPWK